MSTRTERFIPAPWALFKPTLFPTFLIPDSACKYKIQSVPCCLTAEFWALFGEVLSGCHLAGPGDVLSLFLGLKSPLSELLKKSARGTTMKNILHMWQPTLILVLSVYYSKVKHNIIPRPGTWSAQAKQQIGSEQEYPKSHLKIQTIMKDHWTCTYDEGFSKVVLKLSTIQERKKSVWIRTRKTNKKTKQCPHCSYSTQTEKVALKHSPGKHHMHIVLAFSLHIYVCVRQRDNGRFLPSSTIIKASHWNITDAGRRVLSLLIM